MRYLMLIYHDDAEMKAASPEEQEAVGKGYGELNAFLARSGALRGTSTWPAGVTTVRLRNGKTRTADGPYAETGQGSAASFSSTSRISTLRSGSPSASPARATAPSRSVRCSHSRHEDDE